jgi:hypothetical protein
MSAILIRRGKSTDDASASPPPLYNGDRLTQAEFHRRYEAHPDDTKFELIQGIVYAASGMASPLRRPHGRFHGILGTALFLYEAHTPGLDTVDNATVILGLQDEPQPDLSLRIREDFGGQSHVNEDDYIVGTPELLAEVAQSTVAIDLHAKKETYQKAGVLEYVVFCIEESELFWFDVKGKERIEADANGIFRSRVFPGLWIDSRALIMEDTQGMVRTLEKGLASPEHAEFVQTLNEKSKSHP